MPKSYLSEEEKQGLSQNAIFAAESQAADDAGDEETSWAWLALAELPAHALLALKRTRGADFIRQKGLRTETAEQAYGKDWLDRNF
ncbi:hypothetical protein [Telmatospirillum sp. J64-1]|uniref:hypothetical protein n=1 Tax=Telmatospirillum sp. J64-1 TaxID=2502183 RepID=UPI00115D877B|nr:hypothetical protein [Telmatospirillum sp. J64-1]